MSSPSGGRRPARGRSSCIRYAAAGITTTPVSSVSPAIELSGAFFTSP